MLRGVQRLEDAEAGARRYPGVAEQVIGGLRLRAGAMFAAFNVVPHFFAVKNECAEAEGRFLQGGIDGLVGGRAELHRARLIPHLIGRGDDHAALAVALGHADPARRVDVGQARDAGGRVHRLHGHDLARLQARRQAVHFRATRFWGGPLRQRSLGIAPAQQLSRASQSGWR